MISLESYICITQNMASLESRMEQTMASPESKMEQIMINLQTWIAHAMAWIQKFL